MAAPPLTPLAGVPKIAIEIITRAAGAAIKLGTAGLVSEGDVKTAIDEVVKFIREKRREIPVYTARTAIGRAISKFFRKRFFDKMTKEISEAKDALEKDRENEGKKAALEAIMDKYANVIILQAKPTFTIGEFLSQKVNWMRKTKKWGKNKNGYPVRVNATQDVVKEIASDMCNKKPESIETVSQRQIRAELVASAIGEPLEKLAPPVPNFCSIGPDHPNFVPPMPLAEPLAKPLAKPFAEPLPPPPCTPVPCQPVPCIPHSQEKVNAARMERVHAAMLAAKHKQSGAPPLLPRPVQKPVNWHGPSLTSNANCGGRRTRKHRKNRGRRGSMKR